MITFPFLYSCSFLEFIFVFVFYLNRFLESNTLQKSSSTPFWGFPGGSDVKESESVSYSAMSDSVTPWTGPPQAPLSMGFSRQEYWSGLPFPSPGYLPHAGIEPGSPALRADSLLTEPPGKRDGKESACNLGDLGLIPRLGRFPGGGHDSPLQYACLDNPMDRGARQATVHGS